MERWVDADAPAPTLTWVEATPGPPRFDVGRASKEKFRVARYIPGKRCGVLIAQANLSVGRIVHLGRFFPRHVAAGVFSGLQYGVVVNQE